MHPTSFEARVVVYTHRSYLRSVLYYKLWRTYCTTLSCTSTATLDAVQSKSLPAGSIRFPPSLLSCVVLFSYSVVSRSVVVPCVLSRPLALSLRLSVSLSLFFCHSRYSCSDLTSPRHFNVVTQMSWRKLVRHFLEVTHSSDEPQAAQVRTLAAKLL